MIPSEAQLDSIPLARAGEFELSDREVKQTRQRIYARNRDGTKCYRTIRAGGLLMVWRIK